MMCACGQDASTTHACLALHGPICRCGQSASFTHDCSALLPKLVWPWTNFVRRGPLPFMSDPATPPGSGKE